MKDTELKKIQATVIKYANAISTIINVDVEIVDNNLYRIAGTGIYKDKINQDMSNEGSIYQHVLKTGESYIIKNPKKHKFCQGCTDKLSCIETMLICEPIKSNEEIIGVIGLVCYNEKQKQLLSANLDSYLEFLDRISEFISMKVYENLEHEKKQSMINLLNQIIDSVDKGVVVLNEDDIITDMNSSAINQLKLDKTENLKVKLSVVKEHIAGEEEYKLILNDKSIYLIGKLIPVFPHIDSCDKILIFSKIKKANNFKNKLQVAPNLINIDNILGNSNSIMNIKEKIKKISNSSSTVLITGESGTGKELIARAVHSESRRWDKPFVAINCGAIPDNLLESELFGYIRGAFTGADPNGKIGKFELANKGTIFLDEIGDMPLYLQVKILRILQERTLVRIGSNRLIELDIRVIAATNRDLKKAIEDKTFREDLYYRLNIIPLEIPSLRERDDDIEIIMMNIINKFNKLFLKKVEGVDSKTKKLLKNYSWPGNVRELENVVEFMMNMAEENKIIMPHMLPKYIEEPQEKIVTDEIANEKILSLKEIEKKYILKALKKYGDDTKGKELVAKKLGIGMTTLYRKLKG
ncbi:sigma-54 interaction domain-containing protein [Tepidibacter hydrothermalis]|uniref:Sigma 54-interacting transcriptional regulator n=1 Tax=Tepidibacter hydrothermalis TaxID=3036126 RepID=A0ABY8EH64_9FIRM|nr:sigma 54-interacting transcriptional regulator [Tepidibacter hydrothermalis]WFD12287.1 sigma 54-interacting transcriptional regulator [Tepidibacter hydrothermalis]